MENENKERIIFEILNYYLETLNNGFTSLEDILSKKSPLSGTLTNPTFFLISDPRYDEYTLRKKPKQKSYILKGTGKDVFAEVLEQEVSHKARTKYYSLEFLNDSTYIIPQVWDSLKNEIIGWNIKPLFNGLYSSKESIDFIVRNDKITIPFENVPKNNCLNELENIDGFIRYYAKFRDGLKWHIYRAIYGTWKSKDNINKNAKRTDWVAKKIAENLYS
jgi:hypothetical protein